MLDRSVSRDKKKKTVTVSFVSVPESKAAPPCDGCVRSTSYLTKWIFTSLGENGTSVDLTAIVDPGGGLPTVLVDLIQKKWPRNSILALEKVTRRKVKKAAKEWAGWV